MAQEFKVKKYPQLLAFVPARLAEEEYNKETKKSEITVRHTVDSSSSKVFFLRALYTIVCALWTGFLFVCCLQVLLFMVLDLAIESGATHLDAEVHVIGVLGVAVGIGVLGTSLDGGVGGLFACKKNEPCIMLVNCVLAVE